MSIPKGIEQYITEQLTPIKNLNRVIQNKLLREVSIDTYPPGTYIFHEGDNDDFVYYLLYGELEMLSSEETSFHIHAFTEESHYPIVNDYPRIFSAQVKSACQVIKVKRDVFKEATTANDKTEHLDDTGKHSIENVAGEDFDWMANLLKSRLFANIPPDKIQEVFSKLEEINVVKDEIIIKQGDPGDYYYFIQDGIFEVIRHVKKAKKKLRLAWLSQGDRFGEEALLSNLPRNASVIATTDGKIIRLEKESFLGLIRDPAIPAINYSEANKLNDADITWIDFCQSQVDCDLITGNRIKIPILKLRYELNKLDKGKQYIVFCEHGNISSIAAFLLFDQGFNIYYLKHGISNYVEDQEARNSRNISPPAAKNINTTPQNKSSKTKNNAEDSDISRPYFEAEALVQRIAEENENLKDVADNLNGLITHLYNQLETNLRGKVRAEIALEMAEKKLKELQSH